jgi:hypothetical protein
MMRVAFQPHWLEQAIGEEREPAKIAQKITEHPEFRKTISEAIGFAQRSGEKSTRETRVLAEHIVSLIYRSMGDFMTTTH